MNHFQAHRLLLFVQQHIVARISRVQFSRPCTSKQSSSQNHDFGNFHKTLRGRNRCLLLSACGFPLIKNAGCFWASRSSLQGVFSVLANHSALWTGLIFPLAVEAIYPAVETAFFVPAESRNVWGDRCFTVSTEQPLGLRCARGCTRKGFSLFFRRPETFAKIVC